MRASGRARGHWLKKERRTVVSLGRPGREAGESTISAMFTEAVNTHWTWPRNRRVGSGVTI